MVKDNLEKTTVESQKQNLTVETQSQRQPPGAPADNEHNPKRAEPDAQEPTDRQLDLLLWNKLNLNEDPETWCELVTGADADNWPTHLRPFSSPAEYKLVKGTYQQLKHSGYYWGPMTMEEAHKILAHALQGTFLIRDSGQPNVFFTLSYQSEDGPTSVRVHLNNMLFSLHGSQRTFSSFFTLLTYYTSSSCKLTVPYRKQRPESLKQLCRRAFIRTYGTESVSTLPGLSHQVKNYVRAYPHCI
ncbi:suppressor of cytokine signaling 1-like [Echeneis naucrates]|uniref:Suppressor of cytokine signaling 1-like n=1 Tax=Echeneis naucrates TaxID=173247 RepID=A0A665UN99_ECHNA|nr:suppressor of cytokine signaling 1-like [Echeneis naucrates]